MDIEGVGKAIGILFAGATGGALTAMKLVSIYKKESLENAKVESERYMLDYLKDKLQKSDNAKSDLEKMLFDKVQENGKLLGQVESLTRQVDMQKERLEAQQKQIESLIQTCKELQLQIDALRGIERSSGHTQPRP